MEKIVGMDLQKYMENCSLRPIDQDLAMQWQRMHILPKFSQLLSHLSKIILAVSSRASARASSLISR
jgi:hypothetical protein